MHEPATGGGHPPAPGGEHMCEHTIDSVMEGSGLAEASRMVASRGAQGLGATRALQCHGAEADTNSEAGSSQASVVFDPTGEPRGYASDCSWEEQPGGADDLWEARVCRLRESPPPTPPRPAPPTPAPAPTPAQRVAAPTPELTRHGDSGLGPPSDCGSLVSPSCTWLGQGAPCSAPHQHCPQRLTRLNSPCCRCLG